MPPPHVGMITGSGAKTQGPQDFRGCYVFGEGGHQLGHRGSKFPEAIVKSNSATAPSWPGHANLGLNEI